MIKLKVFFNDRNSRIYLYLLNHIYWIIIVAKRTSIDEKNNILWSYQHHIVITVQPDDAFLYRLAQLVMQSCCYLIIQLNY